MVYYNYWFEISPLGARCHMHKYSNRIFTIVLAYP